MYTNAGSWGNRSKTLDVFLEILYFYSWHNCCKWNVNEHRSSPCRGRSQGEEEVGVERVTMYQMYMQCSLGTLWFVVWACVCAERHNLPVLCPGWQQKCTVKEQQLEICYWGVGDGGQPFFCCQQMCQVTRESTGLQWQKKMMAPPPPPAVMNYRSLFLYCACSVHCLAHCWKWSWSCCRDGAPTLLELPPYSLGITHHYVSVLVYV